MTSPNGGSRGPFEILPAIDLLGGRVVRLEQGDFNRETAYEGEPGAVAAEYAAAGARWIHVVDLDGARGGSPRQSLAWSPLRAERSVARWPGAYEPKPRSRRPWRPVPPGW